jgi:serine phosphatase RsbU (regulator of sigma subunit)
LARDAAVRRSRLQQILAASQHFGNDATGDPLEHYLNRVLEAALHVFDINETSGFGTIRLLDPDGVLRAVAQQGRIKEECPVFNIRDQKGIIWWSVTRKCPVLVANPQERFPDLYVNVDPPYTERTISQVAIPLLDGPNVTGVLNIESKKANWSFSPTDVFDLTWIGRSLAHSIRVARQSGLAHEGQSMRMLNCASRAAIEPQPNWFELQESVRGWLGADQCRIWEFNELTHEFFGDGDHGLPRQRGFSRHVQETQVAVWLKDPGEAELDFLVWDNEKENWSHGAPNVKGRLPDGMHDETGTNIKFQLGIPIVFKDRCIGVVWFKFFQRSLSPPTSEKMRLAKGLAAQVGLILQMRRRHNDIAIESTDSQKLRTLHDNLFPSKAFKFCAGDGYVISRPCGDIGGDFYRQVELSDKATLFIVGDGVDHGITGACNMLPLITAFNSLSGEFLSPRHVLWRMNQVFDRQAKTKGGTAVCFVVDRSRDKPRIIVSSAGHPGLLHVSRSGTSYLPQEENRGFAIGWGDLQQFYDNLISEASYELSDGDVIVAFTDGVSEAGANGPMGEFGLDGITSRVTANRRGTPEKIAKEIESAICDHASELFDDYTIMALRIAINSE